MLLPRGSIDRNLQRTRFACNAIVLHLPKSLLVFLSFFLFHRFSPGNFLDQRNISAIRISDLIMLHESHTRSIVHNKTSDMHRRITFQFYRKQMKCRDNNRQNRSVQQIQCIDIYFLAKKVSQFVVAQKMALTIWPMPSTLF